MSRSQPSFGLPLQFAKPGSHEGTHAPPVQDVVPLPLLHVVPHAPQSVTVESGVSQPVATFRSQLSKPAVQLMAHAPPAHDGLPFTAEHA
jgi:hypothetical protein